MPFGGGTERRPQFPSGKLVVVMDERAPSFFEKIRNEGEGETSRANRSATTAVATTGFSCRYLRP